METVEKKPTINIDNKPYEIDSLSDRVKQLLVIHQRWEKETQELRLNLAKAEAANRDLTREIIDLVKLDGTEAKAEVAA